VVPGLQKADLIGKELEAGSYHMPLPFDGPVGMGTWGARWRKCGDCLGPVENTND
jgi:hypothetical protein